MTAIITGDIINSELHDSAEWLPILEEILDHYGTAPEQWQIYRGDSFQLEVTPLIALEAALQIKASIKQIEGLDIRQAIGIGDRSHTADTLIASNGSAFVHSGHAFDALGRTTLAIKTDDEDFDERLNLSLELGLLTFDSWTEVEARLVKYSLEHPDHIQRQVAEAMDIKAQSTVSEGLKRAGFNELKKLIAYYRHQTQRLWNL